MIVFTTGHPSPSDPASAIRPSNFRASVSGDGESPLVDCGDVLAHVSYGGRGHWLARDRDFGAHLDLRLSTNLLEVVGSVPA